MSAELIAILAAATALGGLILTQTGALRAEVRRLADRVDTLADRMDALTDRVARIEGQLDVLREMLTPHRSDTTAA